MPICDSLVRIQYEKLPHVLLAPSSLKELCKSDNDANTAKKIALISICTGLFSKLQTGSEFLVV